MSEMNSAGGQGGEVSRGDMTLYRRAIRNDWPISSDVRARLVEATAKHLDSKYSRTVLAAAKVLIAADAVNVRREMLDLEAALKKPDVVNGGNQSNVRILQPNPGEMAETQKLVQNNHRSRSRLIQPVQE